MFSVQVPADIWCGRVHKVHNLEVKGLNLNLAYLSTAGLRQIIIYNADIKTVFAAIKSAVSQGSLKHKGPFGHITHVHHNFTVCN